MSLANPRSLKLFVLLVVLSAGLVLTMARSETASAAPPVVIDACSGVPDSGPGFDFTEACLDHDACYTEYGAFLPITAEKEAQRAACDLAFLQAMLDSCQESQPAWKLRMHSSCKSRAQLYYTAVARFGWLFFYDEETTCTVTAVSPSVPAAC